MTQRTVAVIGAGVVGMMAASYLQRDGHHVVVIDPQAPGSGASSGNAGCLSPSSIVPMSGPAMLRSIPNWLADPDGPLSIRWSYLPRLAPWLLRFLQAGRAGSLDKRAAALLSLIGPCMANLRPLLDDARRADLIRSDGSLIVYRTARGWEGDREGRELRRRNGIGWQEVERDALLDFDPHLTQDVFRAIFFDGNGHCVDPQKLVETLSEALARNGGAIIRDRAIGFEMKGGRLAAVRTNSGSVPAAAAVLAAGAFSKDLAREAGNKVPLETERGYHAMLKLPAFAPRLPTVDADTKIVATPMAQGVRFAGVVEFAGLSAPPDWRRAKSILALGEVLYPGISSMSAPDDILFWMGHRPSCPDSLPVIGRSRRSPDIVLAFGHGHLGLTAAPMTGRIVADLVMGRPPPIDLAAFSPDRF